MHNSCYLLCQCCVQGSMDIVNHCQSRDHFTTRGFILCLILLLGCQNLFYWLKAYGNGKREGNRKWWSFLWSNTVPYPELPSPDTTASSNVFLLQGRTALHVWQTKRVGSGLVAKENKAWRGDMVTGKLWKEIAFLWRCQYSSLAHYH